MPARPLLALVHMTSAFDFECRPLVAVWEVTRACDLKCRHCRASALTCADPNELTSDAAFDLIEQLRDLRPGVLVLTGGDPLKRHDLFTLVERAAARDLTVAITPSVTPLLTADAITRLADSGISRIALSLDGPDAATHDGLRGVAGAFRATREAATRVRAAGLPLQLNTSITALTVGDLPMTARVVAAFAPELWSVFFVVPVGRASRAQQLDPETCEIVFNYLYDWSERSGLAVKTTAAPAYRRVVLQRERARRRETAVARRVAAPRPPVPVNDGKGFVFVSHTGEVCPSGFLPVSAGNVRRTPLATMYRESPLFRGLRDDALLGGKCGVCEYRKVCGGSRARAFAMTGDLHAEDPACPYQPARLAAATTPQEELVAI